MNQFLSSNLADFHQSNAYLERPRLQKLLENAIKYPLVAMYAGAGYGKTRTVYSFLQKYDAHTSWIQVSERDNVAPRFWESYAHMICLIWPEVGSRLMEVDFPETKEAFAKFEALWREAVAPPGKYVLVYDDFHLLENPVVLRFFEKAIDCFPKNTTVILLSRAIPEINMVGLMMREHIFTIHEDALYFSEDEVADYFHQLAIPVTRQEIREIYVDTRGWAFAINLIGRSLCNDMKYKRYALDAMRANIHKLIESEIFMAISEPLRRFLLRISLIDHLAASLIKSLSNDDMLIREMESINAYIRFDSFSNAYVIHHLFLDYLRQKQHLLTAEERRKTYQEAGIWCRNNSYNTDALTYFEKSEDYDAIMQIVYTLDGQVPHAMARYMLEIFDRIPSAVASAHPLFPSLNLKLKMGLGMLKEASELAEKYAIEIEARPESAEKNRALLGIYYAWALLRLIMCPYTNRYDFDIYFKKMRKYSDNSPFKEFGSATKQSLGAWVIISGESRAGAPEEYIEAVSRSIPHLSHALNGNMYGFDDLAKGELCYFRHENNNAEKYVKQALEKARSRNQYDIQSRALFYLMHIAFSRGDLAAANTSLKTMEELLGEKDYAIRYTTYDISFGFYHLALDQPEQVPSWLKGDFSEYAHPALLENSTNQVKAQYHYQTRQYNALLAFIENERKRQAVLFGKVGLHVMKALSLYQIKRKGEAIASLSEAYRLAGPNRIITPFIQYGKDMRTLTAAFLKDDRCAIPKVWLENINRKASAFAKRKSSTISRHRAVNLVGEEISLTNRETEILRDLSHGLSRAEIAASRNISNNTVKMAVNIIYEKLHVSTLAEAVHIATDHKII